MWYIIRYYAWGAIKFFFLAIINRMIIFTSSIAAIRTDEANRRLFPELATAMAEKAQTATRAVKYSLYFHII